VPGSERGAIGKGAICIGRRRETPELKLNAPLQ